MCEVGSWSLSSHPLMARMDDGAQGWGVGVLCADWVRETGFKRPWVQTEGGEGQA